LNLLNAYISVWIQRDELQQQFQLKIVLGWTYSAESIPY